MARTLPRRLPSALLLAAFLLALPFAVLSVLQGLDGIDGLPRDASRFVAQDRPSATLGIMVHMVAGGLVTGLAFVQASGAIRRRAPALHRASGRGLIALSLVTALGGLTWIAL